VALSPNGDHVGDGVGGVGGVGGGGHSRGGMGGLDRVDWRAIGRGMAAYLAIAVPCVLVIALLHGNDPVGQESNLWVVAAVVIILVAPVVGGAVAGANQPRTPLSHGAAAIYLPAGAFLLVRTAIGLVDGSLTAAQVLSFLLFLMVFTGLGLAGGYLGFWWHRRSRSA
jgi:hypothetical protein